MVHVVTTLCRWCWCHCAIVQLSQLFLKSSERAQGDVILQALIRHLIWRSSAPRTR